MYRILEHAMNDFHRRRHQTIGPFSPSDLFSRDAPPQSVVLGKVMAMHAGLPSEFKEARGDSAGTIDDIFNFQAANIAAILQLVRMVLLPQRTQRSSRNALSLENYSMVSPMYLYVFCAQCRPLFCIIWQALDQSSAP